MNIKCLIVEDEPLAVDIISDFISQVPFLQLVAVCNDAFSAMEVLKKETIDLIFLDIHLPKLKGLDFLSTLKKPPMVVITTAYHEFALKSYEYNVIDYLLKPIEFSRFMMAISKVIDRNILVEPIISSGSNEKPSLFVTVNKKKIRIAFDQILYIESQRENIKIVAEDKTIQTRYLISDIESVLPNGFLRIHRSFIINIEKIEAFDSATIEIGKKEIPIGRSYKDFVLAKLGG